MLLAHHMDNTDKAGYWQQMLDLMDTDNDGKISKQEYITFNTNEGMKEAAANALKQEVRRTMARSWPPFLCANTIDSLASLPSRLRSS